MNKRCRLIYNGEYLEYDSEYCAMYLLGSIVEIKGLDFVCKISVEYEDGKMISASELIRKHFPGRE